MNNPVTNLYTTYINTLPSHRLKNANMLVEAANIILNSSKQEIDIKEEIKAQYNFLSNKIAQDLRQHAIDMAHSKAHEFSPKIKEYFNLSFQLAYYYWGWEAPALLPYIKDILYCQKDDAKLLKIYKKCLANKMATE